MTHGLFGEPFDSGLAAAESHLAVNDHPSAQGVYEELLAVAESIEDSPDVRFLRAHLLANLGMVRLARCDFTAAAASCETSIDLLRGIDAEPMGPLGRQLWLDVLLKVLADQAELRQKTGDLDGAQACLDEADAWLPRFTSSDGTRDADLANTRVSLLMSRDDWGAAEQLALTALATTPTTVSTVPYLLKNLGLICASTGRFDLAEDYFAQALDAHDVPEEPADLVAGRAYVALRRGDRQRAEELYARASEICERQRNTVGLAVCEQARAILGDATDLMATSLSRFEQLGLAVAAAETTLLASQQAYGRGDLATAQRLASQARAVFEERGLYERCAQVDYFAAANIEDSLNRSDFGEHEREAVDTALGLALPAALALAAARYDFASSHARAQWLALADEVMRLVFRLAVRRQDPGLVFELVEFRCAGAPLAPTTSAEVVFPAAAMKARGWRDGTAAFSGVVGEVAASEGLRVALPPKVVMSPGFDRTALHEYVEVAQSRYHRRIVSDEQVPSW